MNPNDSRHRKDVFRAIECYRREQVMWRRSRTDVVEMYAGAGLPEEKRRTILPLMKQMVDAGVKALAGGDPKGKILTDYDELQGFADHWTANLNNVLKRIDFAAELRAVVLDAFFGLGIGKACLADAPPIEDAIGEVDVGFPGFYRLSFDNWVHDPFVSDFRRVQLAGDMYRIDYDKIFDADVYDQAAAKLVKPSSKYPQGDEVRAAKIAGGLETDEDEYAPMVDLMDIWFPKEKLVVTWACDRNMLGQDTPPLAVRKYEDPSGPYDLLNIGPIPDNIMPTSPADNVKWLHEAANSQARKINNQNRRSRMHPIFSASAKDDAKNLHNKADGEHLLINRKEEIGIFVIPGASQESALALSQVINQLDRAAGNLRARAGLGQQASTLGQEQMIHQEIDESEGEIALRVNEFTRRVLRKIGRLMWNDQSQMKPGERPRYSASVEMPWGKRVESNWNQHFGRRGDFLLYNFDIIAYSMPFRSPMQRAGQLQQLSMHLAQIIPQMQQVGGDTNRYVLYLSEYYDLPELRRTWQAKMAPGQQVPPRGEPPASSTLGKPNGQYERRSVGSGVNQMNPLAMQGSMQPGGQQAMGVMAGVV